LTEFYQKLSFFQKILKFVLFKYCKSDANENDLSMQTVEIL